MVVRKRAVRRVVRRKPLAKRAKASGKVFAVIDSSPMRVYYSKTGDLNTGKSRTFRSESNAMAFARSKAKELKTKPTVSRY